MAIMVLVPVIFRNISSRLTPVATHELDSSGLQQRYYRFIWLKAEDFSAAKIPGLVSGAASANRSSGDTDLGWDHRVLRRRFLDRVPLRNEHCSQNSYRQLGTRAWSKAFPQMPLFLRLIVPAIGGLLAGGILQFGTRLRGHVATTDYMEAVVLGDGKIAARRTLLKCLSSLFTIASGGSIGREGPLVQLSALAASLAGRLRKWSTPRLRLLVGCGAAAGIASAYNAPIAGALFVAEIVLGSVAMEIFGPLVFSSVIATLTVRAFLGRGSALRDSGVPT